MKNFYRFNKKFLNKCCCQCCRLCVVEPDFVEQVAELWLSSFQLQSTLIHLPVLAPCCLLQLFGAERVSLSRFVVVWSILLQRNTHLLLGINLSATPQRHTQTHTELVLLILSAVFCIPISCLDNQASHKYAKLKQARKRRWKTEEELSVCERQQWCVCMKKRIPFHCNSV